MSFKKEKQEIHVLLVCYDPSVIRTERICLENQGNLCVETASSNDRALAKIEKTKPDVIVCDWSCAGSDSELARTLRSKGDATPIIVFSFDDEKELFAEVCGLRAIGFVGKSGEPSTVYSNLKRCIVRIATQSIDGGKGRSFAF